MSHFLRRLLTESARLTRGGKLREATGAIQSALRGLTQPAPGAPMPTDVPEPVAPVVAPEAAPAARHPGSDSGRFIAGSHAETSGKRDYKL